MQHVYDADYFLRGKETGVSNYTDYRWLEEPTMALAKRVIEVMGIRPGESLLDWGCARGYLVKALQRLGFDAYGYDISEWAISNCDPEVKEFVSSAPPHSGNRFDHVWCKDCGEHLEPQELARALDRMLNIAKKSILFIVPLVKGGYELKLDQRWYVRDEDNQDKTHIIRWTLDEWMSFMHGSINGNEWTLQGSWHIPGLKPASLPCPKSCGFLTLRRI